MNKKTPARAKAQMSYLLTTKLYCGDCGAFMVGESGRSHTGYVHYYYKCANAKRRKGCHMKAIRKHIIEDFVIGYIREHVLTDTMIQRMVDLAMDLQQQENTVIPVLQKQLKATQSGIENLLNAIQLGIITPSTKQRLDALEADKERLEIDIAREQMQQPLLEREQIVAWLERFRNGNYDDVGFRQRLIDVFVNSIYLFSDRLVLNVNYKNESVTVSLNQVRDALKNFVRSSDLSGVAPPI